MHLEYTASGMDKWNSPEHLIRRAENCRDYANIRQCNLHKSVKVCRDDDLDEPMLCQ